MSKDFSILIATRNRVDMLQKLLKSIYDSTYHKDRVEILVIYDTDDMITDAYVKNTFHAQYGEIPPIETVFYARERSPNLIKDYHNFYAMNHTQGKYIMFVNDDTLFEMIGWDDRAMNTLNEFEKIHPDGILYGTPEDFETMHGRREDEWVACFPLISKKAIEVMGYAFDPGFVRDGADWALAATFYGIGRVVNLRNCIIIRHYSFRSGRRPKDDLDVYAHSLGLSVPPTDIFIEKNGKILIRYIQEFHNKKAAESLKNE
jgi:glycosyltransferase involved in cell wall biosynthesis